MFLIILLCCCVAICSFASAARIQITDFQPSLHLGRYLPRNNASQYLPIVLWHGMGDSCCDPYSIGAVANYIQSQHPEIFIHSIATGRSKDADILSSYFGSIDDQIGRACDELRAIPELQNGFVAAGFSQGGQFLRGLLQRCQHRGPAMHTLVTMGAQHEGVMDIPGCWEPSFNSTPSWGCRVMQHLLGWGAYRSFIQSRVIQAQYFKDPEYLDLYYRKSVFLADINAEAAPQAGQTQRYQTYKENLMSLQRFVLYLFENDITVVPKESSHFAFFDGEKLVPLQESALYKEDRLGLRALDEQGKLVFETAPGFHMQFSLEWFYENVVKKYLLVPVGQ